MKYRLLLKQVQAYKDASKRIRIWNLLEPIIKSLYVSVPMRQKCYTGGGIQSLSPVTGHPLGSGASRHHATIIASFCVWDQHIGAWFLCLGRSDAGYRKKVRIRCYYRRMLWLLLEVTARRHTVIYSLNPRRISSLVAKLLVTFNMGCYT